MSFLVLDMYTVSSYYEAVIQISESLVLCVHTSSSSSLLTKCWVLNHEGSNHCFSHQIVSTETPLVQLYGHFLLDFQLPEGGSKKCQLCVPKDSRNLLNVPVGDGSSSFLGVLPVNSLPTFFENFFRAVPPPSSYN